MRIQRTGWKVSGLYRLADYALRWDMVESEAEQRYRILGFWEKHGLAATLDAFQVSRRTLFNWKATWRQPAYIKDQYRNASVLKNRRVVFNIKGNDYRLVVSAAYRFQAVHLKFVGTHAECDAIDADAVEMKH